MRDKIALFSRFAIVAVFAFLAGCSSSSESGPATGGGGKGLIVPNIDFGTISPRQAKDTMVAFFNMGSDTVVIDSSRVNSSEAVDSNFLSPRRIAPNSYENFSFHFKSDSTGSRTVFDSIRYHRGSAHSVALMTIKANVGGSSGGGGSLFGPTVVDFGMVPVGEMRDTTILIVNTGSSPITITSNTISGPEGRDTNFSSAMVIAPGGYRMIHLQFNPAQQGPRSATDQITYSSGASTQSLTITLLATGIAPPVTTPGPGSTFTYNYTEIDTNGQQRGPYDSTYTVVSNSLTYGGKSNVLSVRDGSGGMSYYHLESNGDISIYFDLSAVAAGGGPSINSRWIVIPVASKQTLHTSIFDSTISLDFQGIPVTLDVKVEAVSTYDGASTVVAAGQNFPTDQGSIDLIISTTGFGGLVASSESQKISVYYGKQLGFYPKRKGTYVSSQTQFGTTTTTNSSDTYLLKSFNKR